MRVIYVGAQYNQRGVALREVHPDEIVLLVDMDRCIGCGSCRLACQRSMGPPRPRAASGRGPGRPAGEICSACPRACETCASPCDYADNSYWTFCPPSRRRPMPARSATTAPSGGEGLGSRLCHPLHHEVLHVGRAADIRFALEEKRLRDMGEAEFGA